MDAHRGEKHEQWLSVPQFGNWDQEKGGIPDYSMDFTKIREMRKQNKRDISRPSIGNGEELIPDNKSNKLETHHRSKFGSHHNNKFGSHHHSKFGSHHHSKFGTHHQQLGNPNNSSARKTIMSYFCCIHAQDL